MTLRRLAAKIANKAATSRCLSFLAPRQLGVGVPGGCETAIHVARSFLSSCPTGSALLKIDFSNAFNCIRRDSILEAVEAHVPEMLPFLDSAYSQATNLQFGEYQVLFDEGVQQGDPLGPLLFCLTVAGILNGCDCDFVAGYLDDVTLGGTVESLNTQDHKLEANEGLLGLSLNHTKCEIIGITSQIRSSWHTSHLGIPEVPPIEASLLGAPLLLEKVENVLVKRLADFTRFTDRLNHLSSHEGLFLLKCALSIPRLL